MNRLARASIEGVKANLGPGLALQALGLAVVALYYWAPSAEAAFDAVAEIKQRFGFRYSAVATGLFGGLIPFAYLKLSGRAQDSSSWSHGLFLVAYWGWKGIEVDALYRFQAWLFGAEATVLTVAKKVVFDQFVFCVLWSAPTMALLYLWKDSGFSLKRTRERGDRAFFLIRMPSVLVSMWIVWIPATAIIYSFPLSLQLPLFNLVVCFFSLLVSALAKDGEIAIPPVGVPPLTPSESSSTDLKR